MHVSKKDKIFPEFSVFLTRNFVLLLPLVLLEIIGMQASEYVSYKAPEVSSSIRAFFFSYSILSYSLLCAIGVVLYELASAFNFSLRNLFYGVLVFIIYQVLCVHWFLFMRYYSFPSFSSILAFCSFDKIIYVLLQEKKIILMNILCMLPLSWFTLSLNKNAKRLKPALRKIICYFYLMLFIIFIGSGVLFIDKVIKNNLMTLNDVGQVGAKDYYSYLLKDRTSPILFIYFKLHESLMDLLIPEKKEFTLSVRELTPINDEAYYERLKKSSSMNYNVIIMVIESLRFDRFKLGGCARPVVPTLDKMSEEGIFFDRAYSQSTDSFYSDISIPSSLYPLRDENLVTMPKSIDTPRILLYDILKSKGYKTAIYSSQTEDWCGMNHFFSTPSLDVYVNANNYNGPKTWLGQIDDRTTVSNALQWMRGNINRPFYLSINFQSTHYPYNTIPDGAERPFKPYVIDFTPEFGRYPKNKVEIMKNCYDNSLCYIDSLIKEILSFLSENHLEEKTILVVCGDHGQAFYEHNVCCHGSIPFEEVIHIPLVIKAPKRLPSLCHLLTQQIDIAPTILSLLQMPIPDLFQGRDVLSSKVDEGDLFYLTQIGPLKFYGLIRGNYKYFIDRTFSIEKKYLFNLKEDPQEHVNLVMQYDCGPFEAELEGIICKQTDYYSDPKYYKKYYPPKFRSKAQESAIQRQSQNSNLTALDKQ